jgi:uncharacterized coiled-coil protein SlyX
MATLVFPALVRSQVLAQHVELRALLERALGSGGLADAATGQLDMDSLATSVRELCARFKAHLTFEEEALKPVFAVIDAWGPERVRDLETEHARQRRELDTLVARVQSGDDVEQMALALRGLAADLLRDMEEEEQGCLRASLMSAGHLTVERR